MNYKVTSYTEYYSASKVHMKNRQLLAEMKQRVLKAAMT